MVISLRNMALRRLACIAGAFSNNAHAYTLSTSTACSLVKQKPSTERINYCQQSIRFSSNERQSVRVAVNDVDFHCEKTGSGDHILLLLPGALGTSTTDFKPQLEKMSKDKFTIYAFDPRGYGKSIPPERTWPLEYLQRDAEDAVAVMKKLVDKKFSVLGWSDGGISGMILAGRYPELVKKLVVWGCNSYISDVDMKKVLAVEDLDKWSAKMRQPFVDLYGEEYFRTHWKNFIKAYSNYYSQRNGDICKSDLQNIVCPTFILHGDKDPMVDPVHPSYLHKHIKNSKLHRMPEGKHNIHLRYADEFNKLVEEFLDE